MGCRLWGRTESDTTEATQQQQQQAPHLPHPHPGPQSRMGFRGHMMQKGSHHCLFGESKAHSSLRAFARVTSSICNARSLESHMAHTLLSVQFSSVAQSRPTPYDPMNRSTPGLPVHHQLPEFTQTHIIESVMPSSHLILCHPLLLLPPVPPSIRVFSNESTLRMR